MATIDNYKIKVEVDGEEKVIDLKEKLFDLQTTLNRTAAAGVAAFTALGVSAVRMADQLVDLANATGFSAAKIYQLSAALEASGGEFANGDKLILGFTRTLGDVEKGTETAIEALTKLGLSRSQIENLSDEQLFQAAINGLGKMDAGLERSKLAVEIFGKAAAGIDWKTFAEGTNKAVDPNLEKNLKLAADAMGSIESAFREFQLVALQAITPVLEAIRDMNITADDAKKAIQVLGALVAGAFSASVVIGIVKAVQAIRTLGAAIKAAAVAQTLLTGLIPVVGAATVIAAIGGATAAYLALGKAMEDAGDAKDKLEGAAPGAPATPAGTPQRQIGQTPAEKALEALKATTAEMRVQNAAALEYERTINGTIGLSQEIADIKKIDAQLEQDRAKSAANYEKQIATLKADTSKNNQAQINELTTQKTLADEQLVSMAALKREAVARQLAERQTSVDLQKQLDLISQQSQKNISNLQAEEMRRVIAGEITQEEANNAIALARIREEGAAKVLQLEKQIASEKDTIRKQELQNQLNNIKAQTDFAISEKQREINEKAALEQSFSAGAVKAVEDITKAYTPYNKAVSMTGSIFQNMQQAISNFTETGKFKFKDFALSIIKDLLKIELQYQAAAIFKSIFGGGGGGGILGSILGSLFKAEGGPVKGNSPYIVGEKGPELFVPKSAGTIIPNNQLSASTEVMGTGTGRVNAPVTNNYITNNISALDAKSVAQLFAENRKTLLGATETARREMAYA